MDIRILSDGPWIYAIYEGDDRLNKKEADELFEYILNWMNTTQYPEEEDEEGV